MGGQDMLVARRGWWKAESRQIQGHTAETTAQILNNIAIHERPANARMEEQQRGAASLIDIMDAVALDLHKAALERVELLIEPLRALHCTGDACSVTAKDRNVSCRHRYTSFIW